MHKTADKPQPTFQPAHCDEKRCSNADSIRREPKEQASGQEGFAEAGGECGSPVASSDRSQPCGLGVGLPGEPPVKVPWPQRASGRHPSLHRVQPQQCWMPKAGGTRLPELLALSVDTSNPPTSEKKLPTDKFRDRMIHSNSHDPHGAGVPVPVGSGQEVAVTTRALLSTDGTNLH